MGKKAMVSATSLRSKQEAGGEEVGEIEAIFSTKPSISTSSPSAKRAFTDKGSKVDLEPGNKKGKQKEKEKEKQRIAKKVDGNGVTSGPAETQHPEGKRKRQPPSNPSNPDTIKADGTSNQDATRSVKKPKRRTTVQVFTDTSSSSSLPLATQPIPKPKSTPPSHSTADIDLDQFTDSRGTTRKRTQDGLRIFSAQELKLGQGNADTPLCPFDCNCCMFHPHPQPPPSFFSGFFRPPHELLTLQWQILITDTKHCLSFSRLGF